MATALSCAMGLDCFIAPSVYSATAMTPFGRGAYERAVIEATFNGGSTWATISLPAGDGSPLALVSPLSCPSQAGCLAVAATARQEEGGGPRNFAFITSFAVPARPVLGR
jgi:hypothetical protein